MVSNKDIDWAAGFDIHAFDPYVTQGLCLVPMNCREWRLVCSVSFALHVDASEARTSQWPNLRAPFNNDACVNNLPLFQARRHNGQWKHDNTAHTCPDHNGNNVL